MVVPVPAEAAANAVKPKALASTAELASTTAMRVGTTFMMNPSRRSPAHESSLTLLDATAVKSILGV